MDPPPLASHVSTWFCPALSVPPLLTISTVRGGIVAVTVVGGGLEEGSSVVTAAEEGSSVVTAAEEGIIYERVNMRTRDRPPHINNKNCCKQNVATTPTSSD